MKSWIADLGETNSKADVVVCDRKEDTAREVAAIVNARNDGRAIAVSANITRPAELYALVATSEAAFGTIDILVASAGLHIQFRPSAEMNDAALEKTLDGNFRTLKHLSQRLLPGTTAQGWGRSVNLGSISAHFGSGAYHSCTLSKAIAIQYVRKIAVGHGEAGVRANTVSPGLVATDMAQSLTDNPDELARELARSTVGRMGGLPASW